MRLIVTFLLGTFFCFYFSNEQKLSIYRNNLKNREFGKEAPQNFDPERATIAEWQGASEDRNFEVKPTPTKTDSSGYFGIKLPVIFTENPYHPFINSSIEEKSYSFFIDSGASEKLYLSENLLNQIANTDLQKLHQASDGKGNLYEWPIYSVPEIQFGPIALHNPEVIEESLDFHKNTMMFSYRGDGSERNNQGSVGWTFFKNYCTFFNFPGCAIDLGRNKEELINDQLLKINRFIPVPFNTDEGIIVLSVETSSGPLKIALDTGTTYCVINKKKIDPNKIKTSPSGICYFESEKLNIEGIDFGNWRFAVLDICDRIQIDGVLGTDFFLEHPICLDFENGTAYIQKPRNWVATQWQRGMFYLIHYFLKYFYKMEVS